MVMVLRVAAWSFVLFFFFSSNISSIFPSLSLSLSLCVCVFYFVALYRSCSETGVELEL